MVFWLPQKGVALAAGPVPGDGRVQRCQADRSLCVCVSSCPCVFQANSRLKQIEKEYTQKLAKSSQVRTLNKTEQNQSKQEGNLSTKGLVRHSSTHFLSMDEYRILISMWINKIGF